MVSFANCKKEIPLPDPGLEKLFGTWQWVWSDGVCGHTNPESEGYSKLIEFRKDGRYKEYQNGKQSLKKQFTIHKGETIYSSQDNNIIEFTCGFLGVTHQLIRQSIEFRGSDTLLLHEECFDCYEHKYVRK